MGIIIRQSFWGSVIIYTGVVIGYVNTLILFPYFLDVEQMGLVRLIQSNGLMFVPLALLGINGAYLKYQPDFQDDITTKNRIITLHLIIILAASLFFSLIGYLSIDYIKSIFEEKADAYNDFLLITLVIFITQSLFNYLGTYLWTHYNITAQNFLNEILLRLVNLILLVLYGYGIVSFDLFMSLVGINYFLTLLLLIIYIQLKYPMHWQWDFYRLSHDWLSKLTRFSGYSLVLTVGSSILMYISYFQTTKYLGLEANGIFTIAVFIGAIIELPRRVITQIISPFISDNFKKNEMDKVTDAYRSSSLNLSAIGFLLAIGIITNVSDLFHIIPKGEVFMQGFLLIILVSISKIISMVSGISAEIILYSKYKADNIVIMVIGAVALIVLNALFIPIWSITGAGIALLAATFLNMGLRVLAVFVKLRMSPFTQKHLYLVFISVPVFIVAYYLPIGASPVPNILIRSAGTSILFVALIYIVRVSPEVNQLIDLFFQKAKRIFQS